MQMPTLGAARVKVATWSDLGDRSPAYALVAGVVRPTRLGDATIEAPCSRTAGSRART